MLNWPKRDDTVCVLSRSDSCSCQDEVLFCQDLSWSLVKMLRFPFLSQEYKACNLEACPEVRRNTPWTPWMPVNVSLDGSRQEQRFRYTCRALLPQPQQLQLGKKKLETRFCPNDGSGACQTDCEYQQWAAVLLLCFFVVAITTAEVAVVCRAAGTIRSFTSGCQILVSLKTNPAREMFCSDAPVGREAAGLCGSHRRCSSFNNQCLPGPVCGRAGGFCSSL